MALPAAKMPAVARRGGVYRRFPCGIAASVKHQGSGEGCNEDVVFVAAAYGSHASRLQLALA
ncbi:hypothetical protein CIW54_09225 [Paraburkholderia sp. T12-10]|nr:hypothetical protein CIW54_09225 [Paraburkholderia sp. T12-10]